MLTASLPPLFFGLPFLNPSPEIHGWLYRGLALLIIGCPCALVISTPVSIISAVSRAAKAGVLIKGGIHLETLSKVKAVAFDKTGTVTEGNPSVVNIRSITCDSQHSWQSGVFCQNCYELLGKAAAVEVQSEHPLARAILRKVDELDLQRAFPNADDVRILSGQGIIGRVDGHSVLVGSHPYFDKNIPHNESFCRLAHEVSHDGQTPLMVSEDGAFKGLITIADLPRQESRTAIAELKSLGIQELVMLSGDQKGPALKIAENIGLSDVYAELLPQEKMERIKALQEKYIVAMVGDGINDAPALAQANVGIAVGGALGGTAQAMETADVTLMGGTLSRLPFVIRLSRAAMRTVKFNVILALGIKLLFFLLVLSGKGTMWMAVFADTGTTLLVTMIGMRLLHWGKIHDK
jgi:Cd2+/Zn2+-exporting ATPase